MRRRPLRTLRLGWGLACWQWRRSLGLLLVAAALAGVFVTSDASYSLAMEQTREAIASTYRGYTAQVVPLDEDFTLQDAVPVATDEVVMTLGARAVTLTRTQVGLDSYQAEPAVGAYGRLLTGRHPSAATEIAVSERAAERLEASVGDQVVVDGAGMTIVGVFVIPTQPDLMSAAGIVGPRVETATAWFTNTVVPPELRERCKATWVEFDATMAEEGLGQGPLGFVKLFRPVFTVLAACILGFGVLLFARGVSTEYRGLLAAGMSQKTADRVVSVACVLPVLAGVLVGWLTVALTFAVFPVFAGHFWGMRWTQVSPYIGYASVVFALLMVGVTSLLPLVATGGGASRSVRRHEPLPAAGVWVGGFFAVVGICALGVPAIGGWGSDGGGGRWWLVMLAVGLLPLALALLLASTTPRSQRKARSYLSRQRARRLLPGLLVLTVIVFVANAFATTIAHQTRATQAIYQALQPAGSLAVREIPDESAALQLAQANPGLEICTRFEATGLWVFSPSTAEAVKRLPGPVTAEALTALDPALTGGRGVWIGNLGEPAAAWGLPERPAGDTALANPNFIEGGQVVLGRLDNGRFVEVASLDAQPSSVMGAPGGAFPDVLVESVARYGGEVVPLWDIALLGYDKLPASEQGRLEGLARSLAPTAFIDIDEGYRDSGMYPFSQLLGYGAALIVSLICAGLGAQIVSEEKEVRQLIRASGASSFRRRLKGVAAFLPFGLCMTVAALAGLGFTWRTMSAAEVGYGTTTIALVAFGMGVTAVLGLLYSADHDRAS